MTVKYLLHEAHDLQLRVHFVLSHCPYIGKHDVRVEIVEQDVILKGTVKTYYQKQMAQEALKKLCGIRSIVNELNVNFVDSTTKSSPHRQKDSSFVKL